MYLRRKLRRKFLILSKYSFAIEFWFCYETLFSFSNMLCYDTTFEKCVIEESIFIYEKKVSELKENILAPWNNF